MIGGLTSEDSIYLTQSSLLNKSVVDTPYAWLVTFTAFSCYSLGIGCFTGTTGVFFSAFLEEFDGDRSTTAIVSGLSSITFYGGGIVTSWMTNRLGYRIVVISGAVGLGLSFFITSISTSIELIYLSQGIIKGLAIIFLIQPIFVVVSEYHVKNRALAMSIVACGAGVGSASIASISQWLITDFGWRWACRILSCLFVTVGCIAAASFVPVKTLGRKIRKRHCELFIIPAFRYFCFGLFFFGVLMTAQTTFLVNFAESKGISPAKAAGLWTYWGISTAAGRLTGGLMKSTPLSRLREFGLAAMGMGFASWLLAFSWNGYPNYTAFVLFQLSMGWLMGKLYHLSSLCVGDVFGVENVSLGMGWFYTSQMPSGIVTPPFLGFVTDRFDGDYTWAFFITAVMTTLSGLFLLAFWRHGRVLIMNQELIQDLEEERETRGEEEKEAISVSRISPIEVPSTNSAPIKKRMLVISLKSDSEDVMEDAVYSL